MHELGLAEGTVAAVLDAAGGRAVRRVRLRVGALQRVAADSFEFAFRIVADGTAASEASLELVAVAAEARCCGCDERMRIDAADAVCTVCGSNRLELLHGDDVELDEIELAGPPATILRRAGTYIDEAHHDGGIEEVVSCP